MSIANTVQSEATKKELAALTTQFNRAILTIRELDLGPATDEFVKTTIIPAYRTRHAEIQAKGGNDDAEITFEKKTRAKRKTAEATTEVATTPVIEAAKAGSNGKATKKGDKAGSDMM